MATFNVKGNYKIPIEDIDDLKPEETLMDSMSDYSKMEMPIRRSVFNIFFIIIAALGLFYLSMIFKLQIINGQKFLNIVKNTNPGEYYSVPVRGLIYDRNSQPLVENIPIFSLVGLTRELIKEDKAKGLDASIVQLAEIIGISTESIKQNYIDNKNIILFLIKDSLTKEEILKIKELNPKGFYVVYDSVMHYTSVPATAHVVGYTAKVNQADIEKDAYYQPTDHIGRYGIEAQYESFLRGERTVISLKDETSNTGINESGNNIYLNIDNEIQKQIYQAMLTHGVQRGAAIAQNPKTGQILGIVSMPSFDNNVFESNDRDKIKKVLESSQRPLFNRAIAGKYSPGSTIKPLLALAGLKENIITPSTTIMAKGSISVPSVFDPNVVYTFNDWKVHGLTDLKKAIADSVDVYFYALGGGYGEIRGLGINKIVNYFKAFMVDRLTSIDLPGEVSGLVPSPNWKRAIKGESWFIGDTYNISIGQGDLLVTPIWLNAYVGAIANGGHIMRPYIVDKITDTDGMVVKENGPQIMAEIPFDQDTIQIIKEGMRQTITSGTATLLNQLPVPVAAKTGTAQVSGRGLNSLFIVFGPYDDPDISLTILVEDIQSSQGIAIRVANQFLSWYFSSHNK